MKLLGKKLYRIRPIKLSKGGFGGGSPTDGMDLSNILPPAPPPLGERAEQQYTNSKGQPVNKFGTLIRPPSVYVGDTDPNGPGTPGWDNNQNNPANYTRGRRTLDDSLGHPGVGDYEDTYDDAKWGWDPKTGKHTGDEAAYKAFDPGGIHSDRWQYSDDGKLDDDPVDPGRPLDGNYAADPGRPLPPGFVDEPEFGFLMPDDKPGYEITPDPKPPAADPFGLPPVEEIQWGSHDPFGDEMPDYTPRPPNMVEKPSGIVQPDLEAGLGDTKPGLSNWVSPVDDGRVDAPSYVVGGGESPQPSPGGGAGEIEKLRAQIKQLQATIADLRSKQQPASRPPEQAPRPEMPMGGGFGGGGFFGR